MAILRSLATGTDLRVRWRALVGRSARSDVRLTGRGASMEHAIVLWDGAQWILRDLRSRNGTIVNGKPLLGEVPLKPDDRITFGDPDERWCWVDGGAPEPCAIRADGQVVWALDGLLLLPDEVSPAVSIYASNGAWEMDIIGDVRVAEDGQDLCVGDQRFQLDLPPFDPTTTHTRTIPQAQQLVRAHIQFQVSSDEEHVSVTLEINGVVKELSSRASHYLLLVLARARLEDARRGIAAEDAGWIYVDDLARQLGTDPDTLNVQVHRARRSVARASSGRGSGAPIWDCQSLIERRRSQMRLGIASISVRLPSEGENRSASA
jgi:hypothetical protein